MQMSRETLYDWCVRQEFVFNWFAFIGRHHQRHRHHPVSTDLNSFFWTYTVTSLGPCLSCTRHCLVATKIDCHSDITDSVDINSESAPWLVTSSNYTESFSNLALFSVFFGAFISRWFALFCFFINSMEEFGKNRSNNQRLCCCFCCVKSKHIQRTKIDALVCNFCEIFIFVWSKKIWVE